MAAISLSPDGFPMAPSQEVWDALNADERARVVAELPNEVTDAEIAMPEGGLEIEVAQDRLRFFAGTAMLLESDELIARLEQMLDQVQQRAEDEARRREEAEREVARLREELERLKR